MARGLTHALVRESYYSGYLMIPPDTTDERNAQESKDLLDLLAPAREAHPEVKLFRRVALSDPASALVDASAGACLTVVGADRHRNRAAPDTRLVEGPAPPSAATSARPAASWP